MAAIFGDSTDERSVKIEPCGGPHDWSRHEIIGYTGDWFHPHIVRRKCKKCGHAETDEH